MKSKFKHQIFTCLAFTLAIGALAPNLEASEIQFWQKDGCQGDLLGIFRDKPNRSENLTRPKTMKNDQIRSVLLSEVSAGTVIELWDDSKNRDRDDWARITVKAPGTYKIDNIERNPNLPGLTFEKFGNGNLAGKVSNVEIYHVVTVDYRVNIQTGDLPNAETNDQVYIQLKGSSGQSPEVLVNDLISGAAFRQGAVNSVVIQLPKSIGKVEQVVVRKAVGSGDAWYLQYIGASGPGDGGSTFDFDRWFEDGTAQESRRGGAPK